MRINGILVFEHEADDLFVGLLHAESGQSAYCVDRALDALLYEAVAAEKFISFVVRQTNFIIIIGPMATQTSYCLPSFSTRSLSVVVTIPLLP